MRLTSRGSRKDFPPRSLPQTAITLPLVIATINLPLNPF